MPSKISESFETMDDLRPHQDEFLHLAELAGIHMDKEIFRNLVQLLNMGVGPDAVFSLLKMIKRKKLEQSRSRKSSQRTSVPKHK